jgi:hypothetical protein
VCDRLEAIHSNGHNLLISSPAWRGEEYLGCVLFVSNACADSSLKELSYMAERFLVAWDFPRKPSGTFYRVVLDELGTSHPGGDYELIQRSVALCRNDFSASRLAALAEHFGAKIVCFRVEREGLNIELQEQARDFVGRVLTQRLHRRGRRK